MNFFLEILPLVLYVTFKAHKYLSHKCNAQYFFESFFSNHSPRGHNESIPMGSDDCFETLKLIILDSFIAIYKNVRRILRQILGGAVFDYEIVITFQTIIVFLGIIRFIEWRRINNSRGGNRR